MSATYGEVTGLDSPEELQWRIARLRKMTEGEKTMNPEPEVLETTPDVVETPPTGEWVSYEAIAKLRQIDDAWALFFTAKLDQHPTLDGRDWDGPCHCADCRDCAMDDEG